MKCPYCRSEKTRVTDLIHKKNENKRYRKCLVCGVSFVTVERLMNPRIEKEYENELNRCRDVIQNQSQS